MSHGSTIRLIDRLGESHDAKVFEWRDRLKSKMNSCTPNSSFRDSFGTSLAVQPPEISPLTKVTSDISDTHVKGTSHEVLIHASPSMDKVATNTDTYTKTSAIVWYKIVGNYIDNEVKPRFARSNYQTKSLHYFHSFAVKSQIDCSHLSNIPPSPPTFSLDEIVGNLLPGTEDNKLLHNNFRVHIERILVKNVTFLKLIGDDLINKHINHKKLLYNELYSNICCFC